MRESCVALLAMGVVLMQSEYSFCLSKDYRYKPPGQRKLAGKEQEIM